jgi:hypothetical protein
MIAINKVPAFIEFFSTTLFKGIILHPYLIPLHPKKKYRFNKQLNPICHYEKISSSSGSSSQFDGNLMLKN